MKGRKTKVTSKTGERRKNSAVGETHFMFEPSRRRLQPG